MRLAEASHFRRRTAGLTLAQVGGVRSGCEGPAASSTMGVAAKMTTEEASQPQWPQFATAFPSRSVVT